MKKIGKGIYTVFATILVVAILGTLIYTNFIDPQRNLPEDARFFTPAQVEQIPSMTVNEFAEKSIDDRLEGDWIRITDLYTYDDTDFDNNGVVGYGPDQMYPMVIYFGSRANMSTFVMGSNFTTTTYQLFGRVEYDDESSIAYLVNAWLLTDALTLAVPDDLADSVRESQRQ